MSEPHPVLYSFRRCPYAMRARIALFLKGWAFELREVDLKNKPEDMLTLSPKGTVPVLLMPNGDVIDESLDIVDLVMGKQADIKSDALIQQLQDLFIPALMRYKYSDRYEDVDLSFEQAKMKHYLAELNALLSENTYLLGEEFGRADIAILPFVRQLYRADETWFDAACPPNVKGWFLAFYQSDLHERVMQKTDD